MSTSFAFDAKEQVRQSVDIVELVGHYIPLRRQGRGYVGLCPWHDDSRPSLQVNPERQSFKCWVCDIGGDIFSFVMKVEGLDFRGALEMLAERAGIALEPPRQAESVSADGAAIDKRTLYRVMAWAEQQFHRCLLDAPEAQPARDYLTERGIDDEIIHSFHLGFAPDRWDWLIGRAQAADWTTTQLERVGLVIRKETGDRFYDRFRGRLLFSIRDAQSRPIAFGGRVLPTLADEKSGAKYINSPETPLFSKSREFYGLDQARQAIAQQRHVVVVEGYTDCLMAHQHGFRNVVAVLGTALGERHLPVLSRFADSITLVLDGDEAGRRRANEILELFVAHQVDLRILTLPEGVDPCDFIASQGSEALQRLVTDAADALEHKLVTVTHGLDTLNDTHQATTAVEEVLVTLARARPGRGVTSSAMLLREQQMLSRIARQFRIHDEQLRRRLAELRHQGQQSRSSTTDTGAPRSRRWKLSDWPAWDRELLELVLCDPKQLDTLAVAVDEAAFASPVAGRLYRRCVEFWQTERRDLFARLMAEFEDLDAKQLLVELDESAREKAESDPVMRVRDLLAAHERRSALKKQAAHQSAAGESEADPDDMFAQFIEQARAQQPK